IGKPVASFQGHAPYKLLHDLAVGSSPGQMLASIDGQRDACDTPGLRKIETGGRDVVRPRAALKRQTLRLCGKLYISLARARQRRPWCNRIDPKPWRQCLRKGGGGSVQGALAQCV